MATKHTLTLLLFSLLVSGVAYAAGAPANVRNVQGAMIDGRLTVTWDPPEDAANVVSYRIYYSHQSILGNEGNYDDFVETNDAAFSYVFQNPPLTSEVIFIGVLAVSKDGVESEGFEVEASVPVPAGSVTTSEQQQQIVEPPPSSSSSSSPESSSSAAPPASPDPLVITAVEAEGGTGVLLTFSKALAETTPPMPLHFQVSDTGGTLIPIFEVRKPDAFHALLITAAQRPDTTYIVKVMMPVPAQDGSTASPDTEIRFRSFVAAPVIQPVVTTDVIPTVPEPSPAEGNYGRNPALPEPAPIATVIPIPVNTADTSGTDLPDSGLGLLGVFVAAGGVAGRMIGRRKNQ